MSTAQLKMQISKYMDNGDDHFLEAVLAMMEGYYEGDEVVVGYSVSGEPITRKACEDRIKKAIQGIEKGKGLTTEDIRRAKKQWKR